LASAAGAVGGGGDIEKKVLSKILESYEKNFFLNEHYKLYFSFNIIMAIKLMEHEVSEARKFMKMRNIYKNLFLIPQRKDALRDFVSDGVIILRLYCIIVAQDGSNDVTL
jgi:hypothetical protein